MADTLRLATRGSDLALRQAAAVRDALAGPRREVELVEVETRGDEIRDELIHRLGRTGAFVRALDERVLAGDADAAVHSLKDVPTEGMDDLVVAGLPERAPAGDVLVSPEKTTVDALPEGATVGTSSLRRRAQLLAARPDLSVEPLRGNVDTRIGKLLAPRLQREHGRRLEASGESFGDEAGPEGEGDAANGDDAGPDGEGDAADDDAADDDAADDGPGDDETPEFDRSVEEWFDSLTDLERAAMERQVDVEYDAVVLAEAGLRRSDLFYDEAVGTSRLDRSEFVPAPGQGAIAVTAADEGVVETVRSAVDHSRTRVETTVERTVLAELGGGCVAPMGVHALVQGEHVKTSVRVQSTGGAESIAETRDLPVRRHARAARSFARDLADRGAADLVAAAREETTDEPDRESAEE